MKIKLTHEDVEEAVAKLAETISAYGMERVPMPRVYPIPRGGIPIAYMLQGHLPLPIVDSPDQADIFIDDLVDSGATREKYNLAYPDVPFYAAFDKRDYEGWLVFPWEDGEHQEHSATDIVTRLMQYIGEDPNRGGLQETPHRVLKAWDHWAGGYKLDPSSVMKTFEDGAEHCNELVIVRDLPFYSHCEHHLAPFFGIAHIGYIPNGRIVGLSKLSRLLDIYARRLQVQERLTNQIANALEKELQPLGVGGVIQARHLCMESRGVCQQGHHTITSALRGVLMEKPEAREEFMQLAKPREAV